MHMTGTHEGDTLAFRADNLIFKGKGCTSGATPAGDGGTYIITKVGPFLGNKRDVWKTGDILLAFDEANCLLLLDDYKTHHVYFLVEKPQFDVRESRLLFRTRVRN